MNIGANLGNLLKMFQSGNFAQAIGLLLVIITAIAGGTLSPEGSSQAPESSPISSTQHTVTRDALLQELNDYRARNGLSPVAGMAELDAVARPWAERMARENHLYHNPTYSDAYPAGWSWAGENCLQDGRQATARDMINSWANSPGHRANMLKENATHVGLGIAYDSRGGVWAVQNFATY